MPTRPADTPRLLAPRLLVSVKNLREAEAAVAGGADWIDLKQPSQGPLGPVDACTGIEIAGRLAAHYPLSAAGGELLDWFSKDCGKRLAKVSGIRLIKLGLAGCASLPHWRELWHAAQLEINIAGKKLVTVVYADWATASAPRPEQIIDHAATAMCEYLLVDTFDKSQGSLCDHLLAEELKILLQRAKEASLQTVVAGSLTAELLPQLSALPIDMLAVRGAVCEGGRSGMVRQARIEQFCAARDASWKALVIGR